MGGTLIVAEGAPAGTSTMTRRGALALIAATGLLPAVPPRARAADGANVLFFTKSAGFEHDVVRRTGEDLSLAERTLAEVGVRHGFRVLSTKDGRVFDDDLDRYDAFAFFTTGDLTEAGTDGAPPMSAQGKQALLDAIRNGKGFVGIHSASDTFHSPGDRYAIQRQPDPYIAMLGGEFLGHGSQQTARVRVADANFPGLQGSAEGFAVTEEWYSLKNFADDMHVVLVLETEGMPGHDYRRPPYPIAWARREGRGRVYYNAMGHRDDVWTSARFQHMLGGAVGWAAGMAPASFAADLLEVTPQATMMPPEK
ncbi:MAG: ThuA domain-containing protein [Xanthobacteraceae bacterium]